MTASLPLENSSPYRDNKLCVCVAGGACVDMHVHMCVGVSVVCKYMQRPEADSGVFLNHTLLYLLRQSLSTKTGDPDSTSLACPGPPLSLSPVPVMAFP